MQLNYSKRKWFDWVCMHHTLSTVAQCKQMDRHTSFVSRKNSHENVNTSDLKLKRWCKALSSSRRQGHISNSTAPVYYMHCIMNTNFFFFSFFRIFWSVPIKLFTTIFRRLIKLPSTTFTHLSSESVSVDVANKAYTKKNIYQEQNSWYTLATRRVVFNCTQIYSTICSVCCLQFYTRLNPTQFCSMNFSNEVSVNNRYAAKCHHHKFNFHQFSFKRDYKPK